jgi:hypothetical protein
MGKLRVGHLHTDAEQARALAQALLGRPKSTSRWEVTIRSQSSTTCVSTLNREDDYVDCDGRGLTTKFAKSVLAEPWRCLLVACKTVYGESHGRRVRLGHRRGNFQAARAGQRSRGRRPTSSARPRHGSGIRQGVGGLPDGFTTIEPPPRGVGPGVLSWRGRFPTPLNPRPATRGRSRGCVPDRDLLVPLRLVRIRLIRLRLIRLRLIRLRLIRLRLIRLRLIRLRSKSPDDCMLRVLDSLLLGSPLPFHQVRERFPLVLDLFADRLALSLPVVSELDAALLFEEIRERLLAGTRPSP